MLKVIFPKNYPKSRPSAYFLNKIFHPHIYKGDSWNGSCFIKPIGNDIKSVLDTVSNMFMIIMLIMIMDMEKNQENFWKRKKRMNLFKKQKIG